MKEEKHRELAEKWCTLRAFPILLFSLVHFEICFCAFYARLRTTVYQTLIHISSTESQLARLPFPPCTSLVVKIMLYELLDN
jgi:hypothetical protein